MPLTNAFELILPLCNITLRPKYNDGYRPLANFTTLLKKYEYKPSITTADEHITLFLQLRTMRHGTDGTRAPQLIQDMQKKLLSLIYSFPENEVINSLQQIIRLAPDENAPPERVLGIALGEFYSVRTPSLSCSVDSLNGSPTTATPLPPSANSTRFQPLFQPQTNATAQPQYTKPNIEENKANARSLAKAGVDIYQLLAIDSDSATTDRRKLDRAFHDKFMKNKGNKAQQTQIRQAYFILKTPEALTAYHKAKKELPNIVITPPDDGRRHTHGIHLKKRG